MNILILSCYDPRGGRHGGEIRLNEIIKFFESEGHIVNNGGLLSSDTYTESRYFLKRPANEVLLKFVSNPFLMEDYAVGMEAVTNGDISVDAAASI